MKTLWPKTASKTQGQYNISQLPADYDMKYNYQQGFRYTNWDKLGPLSRGIYQLGKFCQLPMDAFSFRAVFIRQHFWNMAIYGCGLLATLFVAIRARMKMAFKKLGV